MKPIYLDYAATTPVDNKVAEKMMTYLTSAGVFGNAASSHVYGKAASEAIETARAQVADLIRADASEIIFTSGATEAINLAIKGAARLYQRKGKHIITLATEHKAVLDSCQSLEKLGYVVTYLQPEPNGLLNRDVFKEALRHDTILVSVMHVNNETGLIQDIAAIAALTAARGILLHVDAAQSAAKIDINMQKIPADLLSLSAHKLYGPKGVGALYLRKKPRVRVEPLMHGGGHEQGMRSGTLATHQIVGMGEACFIANKNRAAELNHIHLRREQMLKGLSSLDVLHLNTDLAHSVPHILNVRFEGMIANAILAELPMIAASTGSACMAKGMEGSHVLRAMGQTTEQIKAALRFSFGRFTTSAEIETAVAAILQLFAKKQTLSS
jgi:cysteine desulfurase